MKLVRESVLRDKGKRVGRVGNRKKRFRVI